MGAELRTGPPDFVGVGAFGWASAPWHRLLRRHPDIEDPAHEDPAIHFFDQFCLREMTDEDVAGYHALFPRREGAITGEWTGRYMYDPWTPELLHRAAPDAKILIILGDPIDRYLERIAFKAEQGHPEDELYMADVVGRGRYASQLEALLRHYDLEQVLVLQHERCRIDPLGEYRRSLRFLGVDEDFVPKRLSRWREGRDDRDLRFPTRFETVKRVTFQTLLRRRDPDPVALWPELEASLHEELDPEVEGLKALVPEIDLSLWPNFAGARPVAA
jgi:hypothetical protein